MRPVTVTTTDASADPVASPPVPLDIYLNPFNVSLQAVVTGTVDYDVQYTNDNIWDPAWDPDTANWTTYTDFDGETTSQSHPTTDVVRAVRLLQNSGDGSVQLTIVQSGLIS